MQQVCNRLSVPYLKVTLPLPLPLLQQLRPLPLLILLKIHYHHQVDLQRHYWGEVFEPFIEAFRSNQTPNPDTRYS